MLNYVFKTIIFELLYNTLYNIALVSSCMHVLGKQRTRNKPPVRQSDPNPSAEKRVS